MLRINVVNLYDDSSLKRQLFALCCRFLDDNKFPVKQSVTQIEVAGGRIIRQAFASIGK
jgi:hypothetical protein